MTNAPSLHGQRVTLLGANGAIGHTLSAALRQAGAAIRQVSRTPRREHADDEAMSADLLDARATAGAVADSDIAFLVAGLKYDTATWRAQWPLIMRNVIAACGSGGVRLVFFDNVYAYGRVSGPMTEDTPFNPCSRKGEVRAGIARMLLEAMTAGTLRAMIARAADFYGPGVANSFPQATVFTRLRTGKAPQWIGNPRARHSFTYVPDTGPALVRLAAEPTAWGHSWHLPTSAEAITGADFARLACESAGQPTRLHTLPRWVLRALELFVPMLRENAEMMYQFEHDYVFDSSRVARAFGLQATPYRAGIAAAVAAGAARHVS